MAEEEENVTESPTLSRKKTVRAAHHASGTHDQAAYDMLGGEAALDPTKLKQKREALTAKADLLRGLDVEMVGTSMKTIPGTY